MRAELDWKCQAGAYSEQAPTDLTGWLLCGKTVTPHVTAATSQGERAQVTHKPKRCRNQQLGAPDTDGRFEASDAWRDGGGVSRAGGAVLGRLAWPPGLPAATHHAHRASAARLFLSCGCNAH